MQSTGSIRVLRVITRLNIGGPSIQAIALSHRLAPRGFDTLLIHGRLGEGEGDMRYLLPAAVRTRALGSLRREVAPFHDAVALVQILDILRDWRPHIVHTHMAKAGTIARAATTIYNATIGRRSPARIVHTYHGHVLEGYFGPAKTRLFLAIERGLARVTDRIVAISPQIQKELLDEQHIGRVHQYRVVPLGFDLGSLAAIDARRRREARATLGLDEAARIVTTVGRLTAIKQHTLFLETAALVAAGDPRALFLIVGDGELRQDVQRQATRLGLGDRVQFLGWRQDLDTIYAATDVFLLTSRNEGTPVAIIESLAAAVPVVSTDVGGVRDVVDQRAGLLAPFGDARALADRVSELFADAPRRLAMGEHGRASVTARYATDRLVDDIARLYGELIQ
jgi:glycosyltransferase involved in cell wall biosynthesis